jgi:integrase
MTMAPRIQQPLPKYVQVANYIRDQILRGELRPGEEIPSERQIAEEWGVSRPTATRALAALRVEGLVEARQGAGTFVRAQPSVYRRARDRYARARATGRAYTTNPVRDVEAPMPRVNPERIFGHERRRTLTPEEFGRFLAACRPFYRDHFTAQVGTGLRSGELLGLRRRRVHPELGRIEVIEVRYEAGEFGAGFKHEPKSPASVRVVPMCEQVRAAVVRQLPAGGDPADLVFPGPGGSNGVPRGARAPLATYNLRRAYKATVARAGGDLAHLDLRGPHDLRHTFATWLEDAGIPSRVIDELMGHAGGRRSGSGNSMGRVYRETTPAMLARVTAALDERLAQSSKIARYASTDAIARVRAKE